VPVLKVSELNVAFFTYYGVVRAVNGVSYDVSGNETLGIVGESGSGKSVSALAIMGLVEPPGFVVDGKIEIEGQDVLGFTEEAWYQTRGSKVGMCFQNPMRALNPVLRIGHQLTRVHRKHKHSGKAEAWRHAVELLKAVNIPDAEQVMQRFPHQLSGGMCQRVMIVMAISCDPALLILDEPTTGLDVTIQNQLLGLVRDLRERGGSAQIIITHDLGVIAKTCDRVVVMYAGHVMGEAEISSLFGRPLHPYTKALLESIPQIDRKMDLRPIPGSVPEALDLPSGCPFHPRCSHTMDVCRTELPQLVVSDDGQKVACHLYSRNEERGDLA